MATLLFLPAFCTQPYQPFNCSTFQTKASDQGGGLGALTTLARAVEQEERREELSVQLAKETKALDVLAAEVGKQRVGGGTMNQLPTCVDFSPVLPLVSRDWFLIQ